MVENKMGRIIQTLKNDNKGVYKSTDFNEFCQLNSISRQFFIPYTPQHNMVLKWKNQILMQVFLNMLHYVKLTRYFWGEAIFITIYLQNRQPCKSVDNLSPYELWIRHKLL